MAGETADKVVVELEARLAQYNRDVTQGANAFDQSMKRMQTSATASEKALGRLGGAAKGLASLLTLQQAFEIGKKALDYASSLQEVAQQVGVTAKTLQVYRYAASQFGVSNEEMDSGLRKLTLTMGKAALGADGPTKAFAALSKVLGQDITTTAKTADAALPLIADGLAKIQDPAKRAAIEVELFGRAGQKLDTLLTGGSRGINELAEAAERFGIVLSDEQIQRADETADKLGQVKQVLEARIAGAVADNAGAILNLANALGALTGRMIQFMNSNPQAAAGMIGAIAGGLMKGPIGAIGGGLLGAGLADQETTASLRSSVQGRARFIHEQYIRRGGTEEEFRSKRFNPKVIADPHMQTYLREYSELRGKLRNAQGGGSYAAPGATAPDAPVDKFMAPSGGAGKKGPRGPSEEQLSKERLRAAYDFDRDEMAGRRDILQAQSSLAVEYGDRADLARQMADLEFDQKSRSIKFDLDMLMADKTISAAQKEEAGKRAAAATLAADHLRWLDQQKITNDSALQGQREVQALEEAQFSAQRDLLQSQEGIAETAAERRKVELQLLELTYQQRRETLRHIQNDLLPNGDFSHTKSERDQAAIGMKALDAGYGTAKQGVLASTRGPLEQLLAGIPDTAEKANEALERVAAQGIQSISDGLVDAIMHARSLGDIFSSVAKQILADLLKLQIEKNIVGPLANALGSLLGAPVTTPTSPAPGRASGGNVSAGTLYKINEVGTEGFRPAGSGTIIPLGQMAQPAQSGGGGTTFLIRVDARDAVLADTVRSWVAQGVQEAATKGALAGRNITLDHLRRMNRGRLA